MSNGPRLVQSASQIAHFHFGKSFSEEITHRARHVASMLGSLANAQATGNQRKVRAAQNRLFRSYSAKLVFLVICFDKKHKLSVKRLKSYAQTLNPVRDCGERIRAWAEEKSSGVGWRPVCAFGIRRQALQQLIAEMLKASASVDQLDYLIKGRGAERASDRIVYMHDELGIHDFVVADIKDFFRSIEIGQVSKLIGLPEAVVQNSLLINQTPYLSIVGGLPPNTSIQSLIGTVREGIPQGSRASQTIASLILSPLLKAVASDQLAIMHGDDIVLGAESKKSANALNTVLREALKSHPAGPFRLKYSDAVSFAEGFNFLQYYHRHDHFKDAVHRRPSGPSYGRFLRRVVSLFVNNGHRAALRKTARYRWQWRKSFRNWHRGPTSDLLLWQSILEAMDNGTAKRAKIKELLSLK
ncbi:reverse transcriptase domain-containing protein [Tardiphaga sp. 11_C7_N12_6]|uniref:reverse transcriptase domain-containing protein n=1 Tax=Tardiphaga sp. 11_C7_N12_6 TaxID=3240789 RepID=UPI003F229743